MSTTGVVTDLNSVTAAPVVPTPTPVHVSAFTKFKNFMHLVAVKVELALDEIAKYEPDAALVAQVLFPEYATLIQADQKLVVSAVATVSKSILAIQQSYGTESTATTNGDKLADVISISKSAVESLLTQAGVSYSDDRLTNIVNVVVGILKAQPVPTALAS